jgi:hypothetical protein
MNEKKNWTNKNWTKNWTNKNIIIELSTTILKKKQKTRGWTVQTEKSTDLLVLQRKTMDKEKTQRGRMKSIAWNSYAIKRLERYSKLKERFARLGSARASYSRKSFVSSREWNDTTMNNRISQKCLFLHSEHRLKIRRWLLLGVRPGLSTPNPHFSKAEIRKVNSD